MNLRVVALPSRRRILMRSVGYAAGCGAAAGALVMVLTAIVAASLGPDPSAILFAVLLGVPIAAVIGAVVGLPCGLVAGIVLVALRRQAGVSRTSARLVAGTAAALPPLALSIAELASWLHSPAFRAGIFPSATLLTALSLTLVTFGLAAGCGPRALYGPPGRRDRLRADAGRSDLAPARRGPSGLEL